MTSLEKSINKLIQQHNKYPTNHRQLEKECKRLVKHANHILHTLVAKRISLGYAITAFEQASKDYIEEFSKCTKQGQDGSDTQRVILTNWFTHFLRLRDGFQLMESGERRHVNDDDADSAGGKFESRLSGALRKDGLTRKFKSQLGYTGFGWDEFYDEDVGIRKHLLETLCELTGKRQKAENILGAWEENLDLHDTNRKLLNQQLTSIQKSFITKMNELLASRGLMKLTLVTDDKFEKMTWGLLDIKRSGNQFAIKDAGGSLPIGVSLSQWREKFSLVSPKVDNQVKDVSSFSSKKRRVIEDSSDEDEAHQVVKKPSAKQPPSTKTVEHCSSTGIEVKQRETRNKPNSNPSSLDEIKRQEGISATQLEEARDQIDKENRESAMAACNDELCELVDAKGIIGQCVHQWELLQKHKYDVLSNLMAEQANDFQFHLNRLRSENEKFSDISSKIVTNRDDSVELYRARESYREASMQLGNFIIDEIHHLFSNQLNKIRLKKNKNTDCLESDLAESDSLFLQAAAELFKKSLTLINDQQSSQRSSKPSIKKYWEKAQHLLLRARAQFNIGISTFELAQTESTPKENKRRLLSNALNTFEDALKSCVDMRRFTVLLENDSRNHEQSTTWKELAILQQFESIELGAQAGNECGMCLWELHRFDKAATVIAKAAETSEIIDLMEIAGVDMFRIVQLLCNRQHMILSLLDMCTRSLETTPAKNKSTGEGLLKIASQAVQIAVDVSNLIYDLAEKHSLTQIQEYKTLLQSVTNRESLKAEEQYINGCWENKCSAPGNNISDILNNDQISNEMNRGELHLDIQNGSFIPDRKRIWITDSYTSTSRRRTAKKAGTSKVTIESFYSEFVTSSGSGITEYMPWGDELLKEEERGKYPACCPPLPLDMPLDVRHALEAKLGDIIPPNINATTPKF